MKLLTLRVFEFVTYVLGWGLLVLAVPAIVLIKLNDRIGDRIRQCEAATTGDRE